MTRQRTPLVKRDFYLPTEREGFQLQLQLNDGRGWRDWEWRRGDRERHGDCAVSTGNV